MSRSDRSASGRTLPARLRDALESRFGVDARALAALRISLGALLLVDLLLRARHLRAFYTDTGVLPRAVLFEQYPLTTRYSIHALSGDAWFQAALFLLAGLCAASLLIGYRTRLATALSVVLLFSLHLRNPGVLNGGDVLLRRLLVWGLFLPLGGRWSVDSLRRADPPRRRVATVASAALLLQVVVVYTANAAFKHRGDLWLRGDAVRYVLSLEQFTVFLGDALTAFPWLLRAFDWLWVGLVSCSVLLVLLRGRLRTALVLAFASMHVGMLLTMRLGVFPLVSVAALLPFLPSSVWDRLDARVPDTLERTAVRVGERVRTGGAGPAVASPASLRRSLSALRRATRRVAPAAAATLLTAMLVWNAITVGVVPAPVEEPDELDPSRSGWVMFAPNPITVDGWYVAPGELESGERVDAFYRSAPRGDDPPETRAMYPSARWRKYLFGVRHDGDDARQRALAAYLCDRWNREHEDDLTNLTLAYVEQPTRLDGPEPTRRVELLRHECRA